MTCFYKKMPGLIAIACVLSALPLHAEDKALRVKPATVDIYKVSFEELDVNHDGIISKSEWRGEIEEFRQLDDNGDGVLTRVEFSDRSDEKPDDFSKLDTNHDGVISKKEWKRAGRTPEDFIRFDDNRDGVITRNEFFRKRTGEQDTFLSFDANRDGIISKWEWRGKMSEFKRLDTDHNWVLTLPEFNAGNAVYKPLIK